MHLTSRSSWLPALLALSVVSLALPLGGCSCGEGTPDAGAGGGEAAGGGQGATGGGTTGTGGGTSGTGGGTSGTGGGTSGTGGGTTGTGGGTSGTGGGQGDAGVDAGVRVCPMLTYSADLEPAITEPLTISYPAGADASVPGQGANASRVGYTVNVTHLDGGAAVTFGVWDSDVGQGVPWDDDAGTLTDGYVKAWSIDVPSGITGTHALMFTLDSPVTGFEFAITDLDFGVETVEVAAFPSTGADVPIAMTDHALAAPVAYPALARGVVHTGNDAYIVDQTKVQALGNGRYTPLVSGGVTDRTGTVLFVFDASQPVQRVVITYTGSGTGVWIAGMTYADPCAP
jgi:hypothetical protein